MVTPIETPNVHKDRFLFSLDRCAQSKEFIPTFYDNFISSSQEVRDKFLNTDFNRQNQMLLNSLRVACEAVFGNAEALRELEERGQTHSRQHLNIKPELYDLWLSSLIKAARTFDKHWDIEVEISWNFVLSEVVHHMLKYY